MLSRCRGRVSFVPKKVVVPSSPCSMCFYSPVLTDRKIKKCFVCVVRLTKRILSLSSGTCIDLVNNYTCNCHVGFTGPHCDIEIKNCTIDSCYPNVTCFKNSETISCGPCPVGLSGDGKNCEGNYKNKKIQNIIFYISITQLVD